MICKIYNCRMNEQACRIRRKNNPTDLGCKDCKQGEEVERRYQEAQARLKADKPAKRKRGRPAKKKNNPTANRLATELSGRLEIDFSNHPELYSKIQELAAQELRTPENQVLYILRDQIN